MNFQKASMILVIFLLASCVNNQATFTPSLPAISMTKTATKFFISQMPTLRITETPTPTFTPLVTVTPLKLSKEEIADIIKQQDYEKICNTPYYRSWSPNNQWLMISCLDDGVAQIINPLTAIIYSVDIHYYYSLSNRLQTTLRDELWSSDGSYLFLRPHVCCADGPAAIVDGVALYRVSLSNGDVWTVLPPSTTAWTDYAFAFSPDEHSLVYVSPFEPSILHSLDLATKEEVKKEFDNKFTLGGLVWTPDNSQIVLVGLIHDDAGDIGSSSLFLVNSKDLSVETLVDNDPRQFVPNRYPDAWMQKNVIQLFSFADESFWSFNIQTKALSLIPTPSP